MKAIMTVSLNAAVDVTYVVDGFTAGHINMVREVTRVAGGKANNVARVLSGLGQQVVATGFAGGSAGEFIRANLRSHGIAVEFEEALGENRTCTAVVDPVGRTLTELRERGPALSAADGERFIDRFRRLLPQVDLVIISGSLPPGIPADFYQRLVGEAYRVAQVRTIVDASGAALRAVLPASPYMVKPNLDELAEWAGEPLSDEVAVLGAAQRLLASGPLLVAVSLGAQGLLLVSPEGTWRATPPPVEAVNTVGSGDSLVAGFAAGLAQNLPAEAIIRLAVTCGTANAITSTVAEVHAADLDRISPLVQVVRLA